MNWKSISILAAAALALMSGVAGANDSSHYYIAKGSACTTGPQARVSMLMYADPFQQTSVENFILHARLIPHGQNLPGQNWTRTWSTTISPSVIGGATGHRLTMTTYAKVPDTEKDWDLQIKMQWKRLSRVDWNKTLTIPFHEERCSSMSLPNAAPPSANGGTAIGVG